MTEMERAAEIAARIIARAFDVSDEGVETRFREADSYKFWGRRPSPPFRWEVTPAGGVREHT